MELTEERRIQGRIEGSAHATLARQLMGAAVRYAGRRVERDRSGGAGRAVVGFERGEIGDFACLLHCVIGLGAR